MADEIPLYESLPINSFNEDYPLCPGDWDIGFQNIQTKIWHYDRYVLNKTIRVKELKRDGLEIKSIMRMR